MYTYYIHVRIIHISVDRGTVALVYIQGEPFSWFFHTRTHTVKDKTCLHRPLFVRSFARSPVPSDVSGSQGVQPLQTMCSHRCMTRKIIGRGKSLDVFDSSTQTRDMQNHDIIIFAVAIASEISGVYTCIFYLRTYVES